MLRAKMHDVAVNADSWNYLDVEELTLLIETLQVARRWLIQHNKKYKKVVRK
jgi:hypothetical protein